MVEMKLMKIPSIFGKDNREILRVYELSSFPVSVERVFTVTANKGANRGMHAHKKCIQILSCVSGEIELLLDDGFNTKSMELRPGTEAVLIPSGVWAEQRYMKDNSVLVVLCDQLYDESDYIRNYNEFLKLKRRK